MKVGGVAAAFFVAGLSLTLIGGLAFAIIDIYAWQCNKYRAYAPESAWGRPIQSVLATGVFGAFRAISAVAGIVLLCLSGVLLPLVVIAGAAVSAILFLGELISAAIFISSMSLGAPYVPRSKQNHLEDPKFEEWVNNYRYTQGNYSCEDNEEWGPSCTPSQSSPLIGTWRDLSPLSVMPTSYSWNATSMVWMEENFYNDYPVYPCIIDYNVSKDILTYGTGGVEFYDCERLELVVVECYGGWTQGRLNAEVKRRCRERNEEKFNTLDKYPYKLTQWETKIKEERDSKVSSVKETASGLWGCRYLNIVVLVLELFSCILTLVGVFASFLGQLGGGKRESPSSQAIDVTMKDGYEQPPQQQYEEAPQQQYQLPPQQYEPPQQQYEPPQQQYEPPQGQDIQEKGSESDRGKDHSQSSNKAQSSSSDDVSQHTEDNKEGSSVSDSLASDSQSSHTS